MNEGKILDFPGQKEEIKYEPKQWHIEVVPGLGEYGVTATAFLERVSLFLPEVEDIEDIDNLARHVEWARKKYDKLMREGEQCQS